MDGKQKGKGGCHKEPKGQPDERQYDPHFNETRPEKEGHVVIGVEQCITLQKVVPHFDQEHQEDEQAEVPSGALGDLLMLLHEDAVLHPVEKNQADKKQEKGKQQTPLEQGIDGIGEEVITDVFSVNRVQNPHVGCEYIEQKRFPLLHERISDDHRKNQRYRSVNPKRAGPKHLEQILVAFEGERLFLEGWRHGCPQITRGHPKIQEEDQKEKHRYRSKDHIAIEQPLPVVESVIQRLEPPDVDQVGGAQKTQSEKDDSETNDDGSQNDHLTLPKVHFEFLYVKAQAFFPKHGNGC